MESVIVGTSKGLVEWNGGRRGDVHRNVSGSAISAVAVDAEGWWAVVDGHEVWHGFPDGAAELIANLPGEELRAGCAVAHGGQLLIGTLPAAMFRLRGRNVTRVHGFDTLADASDWQAIGGPVHTRSMARSPDGTIFAGIHVGGVVRSDDGGATWVQTRFAVDDDVHDVHVHQSGIVLTATAYGLAVSDDAGSTWRFETNGLHADYLRAVTTVGNTVLVAASTGPWTSDAAVYRRPLDAAVPFIRCDEGIPGRFTQNIDTHQLAAGREVVAVGGPDGRVYVSRDTGRTWDVLLEGLDVETIAVVPEVREAPAD